VAVRDGWIVARSLLKNAREVNAALALFWGRSVRVESTTAEGTPSIDRRALEGTPVDRLSPPKSEGNAEWLKRGHAYVVTVVAMLLNRYVRHFRSFVVVLTVDALLLLLAVSSYAFEPKRLLLTWMWVVMLSVVGLGLYVYVQLERSMVLSRIGGTEPGKIDVNAALISRVVTWGLLPLLTVAAAQYPQVADALFSWLAPFTRSLH
jgi:hypothetical protein